MIEHDKLPPLPGDLIEAEMKGYDTGCLEIIKDLLKSNVFNLELNENSHIKGPLTAEQILKTLRREMGKL